MEKQYEIYVPKEADDIEAVRQTYVSWVKESSTVDRAFAFSLRPSDVLVERVWNVYAEFDCKDIEVETSVVEFSTTTYHVEAKFGKKIYSDGKYDYYRKEDCTPAHDETDWDLKYNIAKTIFLSKEAGDDCTISCGVQPKRTVTCDCQKHTVNEINQLFKRVPDEIYNAILDVGCKVGVSDCAESVKPAVKEKFKEGVDSDAVKFTASVNGIRNATIDKQVMIIYPTYVIKVKKHYGGTVDSASCASFYAPKFAPQLKDMPYKLIFASILASVALLVFLLAAMFLCQPLSHKGLMQMYAFPMISMAIFSGILIIVSFLRIFAKRASTPSGKQRRRKASIAWLSIVICFCVGFGIVTGSLYSITHDDEFYYTPEIVGHYTDPRNGYGEYELTILSCDEQGNIVAKWTFEYLSKTYYVEFSGKITEKSKSKLTVELNVEHCEKLLGNVSSDRPFIIEFFNDYNSIEFDYVTLERAEESPNTTEHYSSKIVGYYSSANKEEISILRIVSCTESGSVEAEHVYVNRSTNTYSKQRLYGTVTIESSVNLDITFDRNEWIANTAELTFNEGTVATITEEFSRCSIFDRSLEFDCSTVHIVRTNEEFSATKGSSGIFVLENDIDFGGAQINPLGDFSGVLIGNGHAVKNYKITSASGDVGLFSTIKSNGIILGLDIEGAEVVVTSNKKNIGLLCGLSYGTIVDVSVSGTVSAENSNCVGGVAGRIINGVTKGVVSKNVIVTGADYVGGCVGEIYKSEAGNLSCVDSTVNASGTNKGTEYGAISQ